MTDKISVLDSKLATSDIFKKMTTEKREELADAIYVSAIRSNLTLDEVITIIRTTVALDETFFNLAEGDIFSYVAKKYRHFARRIFLKKAGGGTPNAAMGKAELLLLLLSDKTKKPAKGDISFNGRLIEIKANGGKLGLGSGEVANKKAVEFCKKKKVTLRKGTTGKTARGKLIFDPTRNDDRTMVGQRLHEVLAVWWEGLSGKTISNATWPMVRKAFLRHVASEHMTKPNMELLVFNSDGRFRLFKKAAEFVKYYDSPKSRFEYRGYQKNPFSIYLDVW